MKSFAILLFMCFEFALFTQSKADVSLIRQGNSLLNNKKYNEAEILYRKALVENPKSAAASYNLALSLQLQKKNDEAIKQYEKATPLINDKMQKAGAYHNAGNAYCAKQEWEKAIEQYKSALRLNPTDMDTKYNLAYAQSKLAQQQKQQQQQQDKNQQQNQDKNQDPSKGDKDKKEPPKDGEGDKKDDKKDGKEPKPNPGEMTKDQAKKMLNAIQAQEAKVNDKMQKGDKKGVLMGNGKDW